MNEPTEDVRRILAQAERRDVSPLDLVIVNPRKRDPRQQQMLERSIGKIGMLREPIASENADGILEVLGGAGRRDAAITLGLQTIPCIILPRGLTLEMRQAIADADNCHCSVDPMETARKLHEIKQKYGLNISQLARFVGMPQPRVYELLSLLRLSENQQLKLSNGEISLAQAIRLAKVRKNARSNPNAELPIASTRPASIAIAGQKFSLASASNFIVSELELVVVVAPSKSVGLTKQQIRKALRLAAKAMSENEPVSVGDGKSGKKEKNDESQRNGS